MKSCIQNFAIFYVSYLLNIIHNTVFPPDLPDRESPASSDRSLWGRFRRAFCFVVHLSFLPITKNYLNDITHLPFQFQTLTQHVCINFTNFFAVSDNRIIKIIVIDNSFQSIKHFFIKYKSRRHPIPILSLSKREFSLR